MDHAAATRMPLAAKEADPDRELVDRYLDGDMLAFDGLMTRHERQIYALCYRFAQNREDAMDLTQEVFIKAFEHLASFRGAARFRTWLYRIAVNHCLNHVKKESRRFAQVTEDVARIEASSHRTLLERERREMLQELIERLPPKQKVIMKLRMHENLSYDEIAGILGRSVSTVKSSVFFAVNKLKKMVRQESSDGPAV
jgi:RNA polymerase sigma-70 factor (ECF subfamily)